MASMTSYESNINKVNESAVDRVFLLGNTTFLLIITIIILLPSDFCCRPLPSVPRMR